MFKQCFNVSGLKDAKHALMTFEI